jgi:hypothetical protein
MEGGDELDQQEHGSQAAPPSGNIHR